MNNMQLPGADKFMQRLFRRADGIVWDLMTGKTGIQTREGIATIDGTGEDAQITINVMDQFGIGVPAFAQSTPLAAVTVGDLITFGASEKPGWVVEKKDPADAAKQPKFRLMKTDGTVSTWTPPKVSMLGFDSGVMVIRSLLNMLPGGSTGLSGMQGMMLPMMMMGGGSMDMEKMMPLMLMTNMGQAAVPNADGTVTPAANPMAQMMPMMMMMQMMKGGDGKSSSPFDGMFNSNNGNNKQFR